MKSSSSLRFVVVLLSTCTLADAQIIPQTIEPYPLPARARQALCELAGESDVLILGETHGSQEVPAVAAALLTPLAKLGYGALALEIPADEQGPLTDWATGKTEAVPGFFAKPIGDGIGNIQALSLIRTALSPPLRWKLICFDQSQEVAEKDDAKLQKMDPRAMAPPFSDDFIAICVGRDAAMASNLADQRAKLAADARVLAICGNLHAMISNHSAAGGLGIPPDSPFQKLWPSFAAALQIGHLTWRVRSINIVPHSGGYFATMSEGDGPSKTGVYTIRGMRQLDEAEAHRLDDDHWSWVLDLPHATPVTFLAEPVDVESSPAPAAQASDNVARPSLSSRPHLPCFASRRIGRHFCGLRHFGCRR